MTNAKTIRDNINLITNLVALTEHRIGSESKIQTLCWIEDDLRTNNISKSWTDIEISDNTTAIYDMADANLSGE